MSCSSSSSSSTNEKATSPLKRMLAATGTKGSMRPFLPFTVSSPLSFARRRWSPSMTGCELEPI